MAEQNEATTQPKVSKLFSGGKLYGSLGMIVGAIGVMIAAAIPVWQNYWVETPRLSVEINEIRRNVTKDAGVLLRSHSEFDVLTRYAYSMLRRFRTESGERLEIDEETFDAKEHIFNAEHLRMLVVDAKNDLESLPQVLHKRRLELEAINQLNQNNITLEIVLKKNDQIHNSKEVVVDSNIFKEKKKYTELNKEYFLDIVSSFKKIYRERLVNIENRLSELQSKLPSAESKVDDVAETIVKEKSYFLISSSLSNSGKSSISIKKPALLRVFIGIGNYVDLKLTLTNYRDNAEVTAHGTNVVTFLSDEVSRLPLDDQRLINTYWGQNVHTMLFIEDTLEEIHVSNRIAFSEGLYQKIIYDRLAAEASLSSYFRSSP